MTSFTSASSQLNPTCRSSDLRGSSATTRGPCTYPSLYRTRRTCIAYSNPGLAGVELVGAVLRQGSFIEKMCRIGWTIGGRFDTIQSQEALVRCIVRYHGFLWLMSTQPRNMLVPTLVCSSLPTQESTDADPFTAGYCSYVLFWI
jgi:hypothetical protein